MSTRRKADLTEVEPILDIVAGEFGVDVDDLRGRIYGSVARPVAARMLCKHAGMNQREAGRELGYKTGASVCMQLKRLTNEMAASKRVRQRVARVDKKISKLR